MKNKCSIAIVGAGNVATHLAKAFKNAGVDVRGIAARNFESAQHLAQKIGCNAFESVEALPTDVDFIIISTTDTAIASVAQQLKAIDGVVLHTSGSVDVSVLQQYHSRCGVLYPLQTFSKDVAVDISIVPFFIEGDEAIEALAKLISNNIYFADSAKRKSLHIAGVLTSNFPIYLLQMAQELLAKDGFPLEVVHPLVNATIAKAFEVGPRDALTGPGRRGDIQTIKRHIEALDGTNREVYELLSNAILLQHHNKTINSEQD